MASEIDRILQIIPGTGWEFVNAAGETWPVVAFALVEVEDLNEANLSARFFRVVTPMDVNMEGVIADMGADLLVVPAGNEREKQEAITQLKNGIGD